MQLALLADLLKLKGTFLLQFFVLQTDPGHIIVSIRKIGLIRRAVLLENIPLGATFAVFSAEVALEALELLALLAAHRDVKVLA